MQALQGAAIPKLIGMYTTKDGKKTVLMMSYAGKASSSLSELGPCDKLALFHRLVCLHKVGVQHNDLDPRNVSTQSSSGPTIIDFDQASLDHNCPGVLCTELQQFAQALNLDPAAQIKTLSEETAIRWNLYVIVAAFISAVVPTLFRLLRRLRNI
ncbi:hypothetical protein B0H15DRAFT_805691 [Mycena belliarum]|uniref:Protein kinase domain-containing protein n=1 Tax=Mycena belliarum TaxID=1033014 RepID=A0AAD6XJV0_9AGAR|nr:hypothetical protein B0H15DRAFT_805691 [Mycena belliae]